MTAPVLDQPSMTPKLYPSNHLICSPLLTFSKEESSISISSNLKSYILSHLGWSSSQLVWCSWISSRLYHQEADWYICRRPEILESNRWCIWKGVSLEDPKAHWRPGPDKLPAQTWFCGDRVWQGGQCCWPAPKSMINNSTNSAINSY